MCSGHVPSLLCLLFTVTGSVGALNLSAAQSQVIGYENGSVTLSVSYQTNKEIQWLQIRWEKLIHPKPTLVICTIQALNSSNHKEKHSIKLFPHNGYEKRMSIVPDNGSLVMERLKMVDSGRYRVSVLDSKDTVSTIINVTVNPVKAEEHVDDHVKEEEKKEPKVEGHCICHSNSSTFDVATSAWIVLGSRLSSILITLLLLFGIHVKSSKSQRLRKLKMLPPELWLRISAEEPVTVASSNSRWTECQYTEDYERPAVSTHL